MQGLGRTSFSTRAGDELSFTRLGFGAAPIGNMHRVLTEPEADGVVEAAWAAGMRYFDTAPLYGHGLSEMRVGRTLAGKPRGEFLISTKVGRLLEPCGAGEEGAGIYKATPQVRGCFDYSYDGVMRSYEASLSRLGLDRVDILYVHDVDARNHGGWSACEARIGELIDAGGWRALDELRAAGDVKAIGAGVNEWEPCARLLELADPDLFLLAGRYTLLEQAPLDGFFTECARRGVGIVNGGPFNSGVLARPKGGHFDYGAAPEAIIARVEALQRVCEAHGVSLIAAALQFAGAHPLVVSVIPGAQTLAELQSNLAALRVAIPAGLWDDLRAQGLLHPAAPVPAAEAQPC